MKVSGSARRAASVIVSLLSFAGASAQSLPTWNSTPWPGEPKHGGGPAPRDTCPCTDGTPENEPDCGVPTDTVNGGCNYTPNRFSPIVPGQVVCGTVGTGTNLRDTDWYGFTINTPSDISWTVRPEFEARVIILQGACGMTELVTQVIPACTSTTITATNVPPGPCAVFVAYFDFNGLPCGSPGSAYRGELHVTPVNDDCASATVIASGETVSGTLVGATRDGTATCGSASDSVDVWYRFVAPSCGTLTATTCGTHDMNGVDSGIDTVLSAIVGGCGGTQVACNDDLTGASCPGDTGSVRDSLIVVNMNAGEEALLRVSKFSTTRVGPFVLTASFASTYANEACAGAAQIFPGQTPFCTIGAATEAAAPAGCVQATADVWYRYASQCAGRVTIDTCAGGSYDSVITVYRAGACSDTMPMIACNDDAGCGFGSFYSSRVAFQATATDHYLIRVGGYNTAVGSGVLTLTCAPCTCDFNADGRLNSQDFFDYLNCFFGAGCPVGSNADFNADGRSNSQDFFDFLACFFAPPSGC